MVTGYLSVQCCFCIKPGGQSFFRCCKHPASPDGGQGGCWNIYGQVHQGNEASGGPTFTTTDGPTGDTRWVDGQDLAKE